MTGSTWWVEPMETVKNLEVQVLTLGDLVPGGRNEAVCVLTNRDFWGRTVTITVESGKDGDKPVCSVKEVSVPGNRSMTVTTDYGMSGVGIHRVSLTAADRRTGKILVTATQTATIAAIQDAMPPAVATIRPQSVEERPQVVYYQAGEN